MNRRSPKRIALDREYTLRRKEYLKSYPCCQARLPGCSGCKPDQLTIHHKKGRGLYYLDKKYFMTACLNCHRWIEEHPAESQELGFSLHRLS